MIWVTGNIMFGIICSRCFIYLFAVFMVMFVELEVCDV